MAPPPPNALSFENLPSFQAGVSEWIERAMKKYLPSGEPADLLYDLAQDYPNRGGKKFRPGLLLLSTALTGGDPALALPSAVALELFQNFALVHDDIEDDSQFRRGAPALHKIHGLPLALNAGDLLFGLVFETLLDNGKTLGHEKSATVQETFLKVFRRTFEGQAMDIGWCRGAYFPTRTEYQTMIRKKTGWYSGRGPCSIGAMISGAEENMIEILGDFGERLGIGFQVKDDLLNLTANSSHQAPAANSGGYGKERGGDIAEGKRTLIVIEMMERLDTKDRENLREILVKPPGKTEETEVEWAIEKAGQCGALESVEKHCHALGKEAQALLEPLPDSPQKALFHQYTQFLVESRHF